MKLFSLNCCKWLQINRTFFQVATDLSEGRKWIDGGNNPSSACKFRSKPKSAIESKVIRTGRLKTGKWDLSVRSVIDHGVCEVNEGIGRRLA